VKSRTRICKLTGNAAAINFGKESQSIITKALNASRLNGAGRTVKNWTNNLVHLPNHKGPHPLEYH
jgi:hypothetical protein